MKKKYKDLIKNKFAWIGFLIAASIGYYLMTTQIGEGYLFILSNLINGLVCSLVTCSSVSGSTIFVIILTLIFYGLIGFSLGLLVQKIWRKL